MTNGQAAILAILLSAACAARATQVLRGGPPTFAGTDEQTHVVPERPPYRFTVLVFFSKHCHCLAAHDERLRRMYARYRLSGVQFFAVDSEVTADVARDREEAEQRSYPFPILIDPMGRLARTLGVLSAGHAVVLNGRGEVAYEGGIDSDKVHLHDDATPFLSNALDDLLADRAPRVAVTDTPGCALHTALHQW